MSSSTLDITWHLHKKGNTSGVPLLFLHGFMGRGGIWLPIMEALDNEKFYMIAPDLPGHGLTSCNLSNLNFDSLAQAIAELVDTEFSSPPVLIGYSMGGRVALHTALTYSEKFAALVLESCHPGIEDETERMERLTIDRNTARRLQQSSMPEFLEWWYAQPIFSWLHTKPEMVANIIVQKTNNNPNMLADVVVRLSPGRQKPMWQNLSSWKKPAMIIAGEQDATYAEIARRMATVIPHSAHRIVPEAGHIVHLENRKEFISVLDFFFASFIL